MEAHPPLQYRNPGVLAAADVIAAAVGAVGEKLLMLFLLQLMLLLLLKLMLLLLLLFLL